MSRELPLSTRILLVLNISIVSFMTRGSSWGYFTPLVSSSEKKHVPICPSLLQGWYPVDAAYLPLIWFLKGFEQPTCGRPIAIVFISPFTLGERWDMRSSSLGDASHLSSLSSLDLLGSPFFTNLCNFPFHMSSSICSFRSLQSSA